MIEFAINTFIVLFVVIDPVGLAPIFGALTHGTNKTYRRRMAIQGILVSAVILVVFTFAGKMLLNSLGISIEAFRFTGGFLLFLISIDMVFARQSGLRSTTKSEQDEAQTLQDISVVPLAIPLVAGPGSMTTLILMYGEIGDEPVKITILLATLLFTLLLTFFALIFSAKIMKLIGEIGANVVSRLLGVLLAALAVQFMFDGIKSSFF